MHQLALDIGLHSGPTLQNFCVGSNGAAVQHLELWLGSNPAFHARSPVPTYFWGAHGSGKTHLLRATLHALHAHGLAVGWLDPRADATTAFDERWAAVLMDDVHFYSPSQQHTAFSWFVQAQSLQRPVVAAGEMAPADLALRDDLRSRLGWGHIFRLQVLTEPERRAVLRQAADARGVFLGDEVMDFILTRFSRDLGHLMNLLDLLDGYSLQTQRAVTIPLVKSMMENS